MTGWRRPGLEVMALSGIALLLFGDAAFTQQRFFLQDFLYYEIPYRRFGAECVWLGQAPTWNPFIFSGMPFLANLTSAMGFPGNLPFWFSNTVWACSAYVTVHTILAGVGLAAALAALGAGRLGRLSGAVVYAASGFVVSRVSLLNALGTAAWWPFILLALAALLRRPTPGASVVLGLSVIGPGLAGHPTEALLAGTLAAPVLACRITGNRAGRLSLMLAGAAAVTLLAGAVQWWPAADWLSRSFRQGGLSYPDATVFSFHPGLLPGLVNRGWVDDPGSAFWIKTLFIGWPAMLLLLLAPAGPARAGAAWLVGLGLALAFGQYTPVYHEVWRWASWMRGMRYPATANLVTMTGLAVLCGLGAHTLRGPRSPGWQPVRAGTLAGLALVGGLLFLYFREARRLNPTIDRRYYAESPPTIKALRNAGSSGRFMLSPRSQDRRWGHGGSVYERFVSLRDGLPSNVGMLEHLRDAAGYDALAPRSWRDRWDTLARVDQEAGIDVASLLGVTHLVSFWPVPSPRLEAVRTDPIHLYRLRSPLTRAVAIPAPSAVHGPPGETVIPTSLLLWPRDARTVAAARGALSGQPLEIKDLAPDRVEVRRGNARGPAVVALLDSPAPGWLAVMRGEAREVGTAFGCARTVRLDAGEERVTFRYRAPGLASGLIMTALCLLLLSLFACRARHAARP